MKVPLSWLKEYVAFEDTVAGLADRLTFSGVEVEGIETIGGDYAGLLVAEVRAVEPHPQADRLTVCRVYDGQAEVTVVCGAPNVRPGMKAAFAPVGAALPGGQKLKRAKIRQVESFGMLLAEDELGLSDDHSGIMECAAQWAAGTPLAEVLGPPETVLDLEITPNRPDCLCLLGIAREVAALYGVSWQRPAVEFTATGPVVDTLTHVQVEDPEACPRYTARILHEVKIGPSPDWMQQRLSRAGIRPINNVVDITNYVMLETGHPLHAFDQTLLAGGGVVVRRATAGEKIMTLDNVERILTPEMLVIADEQRAVAIAGVMGGAGSEIRAETRTVLLESAAFDPHRTRRTSRDLALSTESSYRFERGVDPATVEWASQRAAALMVAHAGAVAAQGVMDVYPQPVVPRTVRARWSFIRELTGMPVSNTEIAQHLSAIELVLQEQDDAGFTAQIPSFRGDLEREVDIVEEVARLHGLEHIPTPPPRAERVPGAEDRGPRAVADLKTRLAGLGLREIMNYSLTSPALLDLFNPADCPQRVVLPNPISADQSVLRPSLIPHMAETLARNHARQIEEALFFECGRAYWRTDDQVHEEDRVAVGLLWPVGRDQYTNRTPPAPEEMFAWLKGVMERLFAAQGIVQWRLEPVEVAGFEPGQVVEVHIDEQRAGVLGLLHADIRREWRLSAPVGLAEWSAQSLLGQVGRVTRASDVPVYPAIDRDMALVVETGITHAMIMDVIRKAVGPELEQADLFDIFTGKSIGADRKSMAYRLRYRAADRTLTDGEANAYHEGVKDAIRRELGVVIREK